MTTIHGTVRHPSNYNDGEPRFEVNIPKGVAQAAGLPFQINERVPIRLRLGADEYQVGLRSTEKMTEVWISPDVISVRTGSKERLSRVLSRAGYKDNATIQLKVEALGVLSCSPLRTSSVQR